MKRVLSILLLFFILFSILPLVNASETTVENIDFVFDEPIIGESIENVSNYKANPDGSVSKAVATWVEYTGDDIEGNIDFSLVKDIESEVFEENKYYILIPGYKSNDIIISDGYNHNFGNWTFNGEKGNIQFDGKKVLYGGYPKPKIEEVNCDSVCIKKIELDSKSENTVINKKTTFEGLNINFDLKFYELNDFVKYKIVLSNPTDQQYKLSNANSSDNILSYDFEYEDNNKTLEPNSDSTIYVTVKYNNKLSDEQLESGNYIKNVTSYINLGNEDTIINPKTGSGREILIIIMILLLLISLMLFKYSNRKILNIIILFLLISLPLGVYAIQKLQIKIESKIEIGKYIYWALQDKDDDEVADVLLISSNKVTGLYDGKILSDMIPTSAESLPWTSYDFAVAYYGAIEMLNNNYDSTKVNLIKVEGNVAPKSLAYWFQGVGLFSDSLDLDLSGLNTKNVEDMTSMFAFAGYSAENLNFDLSNFDTSNAKNMSSMFYSFGRKCRNLNINLSNWDTSKVKNMRYMFNNSGFLTKSNDLGSYNLEGIENWDTSNVEDMSFMFSRAALNVSSFDLDLSSWNTSNVKNMEEMFSATGNNSTSFNINIGGWNMVSVKNLGNMFVGAARHSTNYSIIIPKDNGNGINNEQNSLYGSEELVNTPPPSVGNGRYRLFTLAE